MEKTTDNIYLLWGGGGLCGITSNDRDKMRDVITEAWDKSFGVAYNPNDVEVLIDNGEIDLPIGGKWYFEEHPINALYEEGTNLICSIR